MNESGRRSSGLPRVVVASTGAVRPPADEPWAHRPLLPDGLAHALVLGSGHTRCGLPVTALTPFPGIAFDDIDFLRRCTGCVRAAVSQDERPQAV